MGFLKEKYTKPYYTGLDDKGNLVGYGALGADDWRKGGIHKTIRRQIDDVKLENKHVFEIGYGRAESARYMMKTKGIASYFGIDFSEDAFELAKQTLSSYPRTKYDIVCRDALPYLESKQFTRCYDVCFMLDVIEHIPQQEARAVLKLVHQALVPGGMLSINTPFYQVDEDYIAQGHIYIDPSKSDLNPATKGMHCNKFTRERFMKELRDIGFKYIQDRLYQK